MEIAEIINHWIRMSEEKWKTVEALMEKERYADALFFCHLTLELLLKGAVFKSIKEPAPYIHDLPRWAYLGGLEPEDEQKKCLEIITTFNVEGRYDDYKLALHKRATREYTREYVQKANDLRLWIQKKLQ